MSNKTAFITGYTGQDGTFLTKLLLEKGYKVIGLVRRISTEPPARVRGKFDFSRYLATGQLVLEQGDLLSPSSLNRIIDTYLPNEIYNLAAQSHVGQSFQQPEFTIDTILTGTINLINALESSKRLYIHRDESWRMYQASTSEMFGDIKPEDRQSEAFPDVPRMINEDQPLNPNSPYAIAKAAAHQYCKMKRNQGLFIACGILFNHESEIRGGDFVTQKIARGVAEYAKWLERTKNKDEAAESTPILHLGNLNASRDWGYAADYVDAMWRMLQYDTPDDYVVATSQTHTIREFVEAAFAALDRKVEWDPKAYADDSGVYEAGRVNGNLAIVVDPKFYRPNDVSYLIGDYTKAEQVLGWKPAHKFDLIVKIMVDAAQGREQ